MKHLIYLHGFLSSPKSQKAQQTKQYFQQHFPDVRVHIPTLLGEPAVAVSTIESVIDAIQKTDTPIIGFIGSSMGGYLSTYFAVKLKCKAVLINPAVEPYNLMAAYIGAHVNPYTNEKFNVTPQTIEILRNLDTPISLVEDLFRTYVQEGDETLDYRLAVQKYGKGFCNIESGGDHSYVGFETKLPEIANFLFS